MTIPAVITIDFETTAIKGRPDYPPVPVGFSIVGPDETTSRYYSWGHPCENNCTLQEATGVLQEAWNSDLGLLFHNAKFDVDVAQTHMGCGPLPHTRLHDTLVLLFLNEPHADTLSLKPSSERLLGLPPDEQSAVRDWLMAHQDELRRDGLLPKDVVLSTAARPKDSPSGEPQGWGAYICLAPGKLVGTYADGDVTRTKALFNLLWEQTESKGMVPAYLREMELLPIMLENERQGVKVDIQALRDDYAKYTQAMADVDAYVRERLGVPEMNINSAAELAAALESSGVVTRWVMTKTGKKSTKKDNMTPDMFDDIHVAQALGYRSRLKTCLGTFIEPWLKVAEKNNGYIFTNWSQVRQTSDRTGGSGARTGRISSSPNFQNIPKNLEDKDDGYVHPEFLGVPELPLMRRYVIPDTQDSVLLHRDYSQQELRILAHFEDGKLMDLYNDNPEIDIHEYVKNEILRLTHVEYKRSAVKQVNFGIIYGMGYGAIAKKINDTVETAKAIKTAQRKAMPGMNELEKEVKKRGAQGLHITTWGGRHYFCEEPKLIAGHLQTFEYKLLNYLIQGSAADVTKQALINYHKTKKHGRFLITVHDEINISCPAEYAEEEMAILREAMESVKLDVALLSDGKISDVGGNWAKLTKFKELSWSELNSTKV